MLWWLHGIPAALVVVALSLIGLVLTRLSRIPRLAWLSRFGARAAHLFGRALAFVLLAPIFFLVLTPFGLLARRGARDRLARRFERSAGAYWIESGPPRPMERPF